MSEELKDFAVDTALRAGKIIKDKFGAIKTWTTKEGKGDIVTEADTEAESCIIERIRRVFPSHGIVSEESGNVAEGELTWYIDPLDGTGNYARGVPFFCATLAVAKGNHVVAAATYDPLRDEMFSGALGKGAFLGVKRMKIKPDSDLEDSMVSVSWSRRRPGSEKFPGYIARLAAHTSYLRRLGSAALAIAYVASGRLDAYIQGQITPWDIAAGVLFVTEAGGAVTDFEGNAVVLSHSRSDILAANSALHRRLLDEIVTRE